MSKGFWNLADFVFSYYDQKFCLPIPSPSASCHNLQVQSYRVLSSICCLHHTLILNIKYYYLQMVYFPHDLLLLRKGLQNCKQSPIFADWWCTFPLSHFLLSQRKWPRAEIASFQMWKSSSIFFSGKQNCKYPNVEVLHFLLCRQNCKYPNVEVLWFLLCQTKLWVSKCRRLAFSCTPAQQKRQQWWKHKVTVWLITDFRNFQIIS